VTPYVAVYDGSGSDSEGTAGESSNAQGEDSSYIDNDVEGYAPFDWDQSTVTIRSVGNAGADVVNNFQVGFDFIALEGALAASTLSGAVVAAVDAADAVMAPVDSPIGLAGLVSRGTTPAGDSYNTMRGVGWNFPIAAADQSFTITAHTVHTLRVYDGASYVGQIIYNLNVTDVTYANLDAYMAALNATGYIQAGDSTLLDNVLAEGLTGTYAADVLTISVPTNLIVEDVEIVFLDHPSATTFTGSINGLELVLPSFDLSEDEYGLITSADSLLGTDDITDAALVAVQLSTLFELDGASGNDEINTSVFAVTASDDSSVTAIWSHLQSSTGDSTIDALELSLLAVVNTTGGEFSLDNFKVEETFIF
jgi:hypothetical protein